MHDEFMTWLAVYQDGTSLAEHSEGDEPCSDTHPDHPHEHAFGCIDQSRLRSFILRPIAEGLPTVATVIDDPSKRLIFFRRKAIDLDSTTQEQGNYRMAYAVGWQQTVKGTNVKSVSFCLPDGSILVTHDPDSVNI